MTIYQGQFPTPGTSADIYLRLEIWENAQDVAGNQTQIGWRLYLYKANSQGGPWDLNPNPGSAQINGTSIYGGGDTYDFRSPNNYAGREDPIAGTGYMWIAHDPNGTKTIGFSASYDGDATIGDASLSGSRTLPAIPRNRVRVGVDGAWEFAELYVGVNGEWKMGQPHVGDSGSWKLLNNA